MRHNIGGKSHFGRNSTPVSPILYNPWAFWSTRKGGSALGFGHFSPPYPRGFENNKIPIFKYTIGSYRFLAPQPPKTPFSHRCKRPRFHFRARGRAAQLSAFPQKDHDTVGNLKKINFRFSKTRVSAVGFLKKRNRNTPFLVLEKKKVGKNVFRTDRQTDGNTNCLPRHALLRVRKKQISNSVF